VNGVDAIRISFSILNFYLLYKPILKSYNPLSFCVADELPTATSPKPWVTGNAVRKPSNHLLALKLPE
jgi:hypothetical protein